MNTKLPRFLCVASIAAMSCAAQAANYEWTFNDETLSDSFLNGTMAPVGGTITGIIDTNGASIPHIGGVPAKVLSVPAFTDPLDGYNLTFGATIPNGGGAYVNQYTIIFDLYSPGAGAVYQALFQTNPDNPSGNDADFYIADDNSVGIGALTYSAAGAFQQNTWHRLAFAADLGLGRATFYVDGVQVAQRSGDSILDGRFALFSNIDPGSDLRLFNEGDTSGIYTHEFFLNSIAFVDHELTPAEMSALGGANAGGILIPEPTTGMLFLAGLAGWGFRRRRASAR